MKKYLAAVLAAVFSAVLAGACAEIDDFSLLGIHVDFPDAVTNWTYSSIRNRDDGAVGLNFWFVNADVMTPLLEKLGDTLLGNDKAAQTAASEAYIRAEDENWEWYGQIIGVPAANLDACREAYGIDDEYTEIGENGGYTYYAVKYDPGENSLLSGESRAKFEAGKDAVYAVIDSVKLVPRKKEALASFLGDFTTVDMEGNPVDGSLFEKADLTVLNVWTTTCNPCIREMPELAAWAVQLPENVQVVGVLKDVRSASDKSFARARQILEKTNAGYTNLLRSDSLDGFLGTVTGTPTTFFLDRNGQSVCNPVVGARMDDYKAAVEAFLKK